MRAIRVAALAGAVAAIAALAPSVSGQSVAFAQDRGAGANQDRPRSRELTVLAGRGGELGIRITDAAAGGVEVQEVEPEGAADKAGLKRGDIIVEFDGEHVRSSRQFARIVQETPAGRTVKATITREGQKRDLQITPSQGRGSAMVIDGGRLFDGDLFRERLGDQWGNLDRLRDLPFNFNFDFDLPRLMTGGRLGVSVTELTRQLGDYFGAREGVLVTGVTDGSAAARAGIKAGDVITSINGTRVNSREDLQRALRDVENEEVTVGVVRDKKDTTIKAKIEPPRRPSRGARPV
jgi:serine protease Do